MDLPFLITPSLDTVARAELLRLSSFRAPKDKLTILVNCMQIVVDLIQKLSEGVSGNDQVRRTRRVLYLFFFSYCHRMEIKR